MLWTYLPRFNPTEATRKIIYLYLCFYLFFVIVQSLQRVQATPWKLFDMSFKFFDPDSAPCKYEYISIGLQLKSGKISSYS